MNSESLFGLDEADLERLIAEKQTEIDALKTRLREKRITERDDRDPPAFGSTRKFSSL